MCVGKVGPGSCELGCCCSASVGPTVTQCRGAPYGKLKQKCDAQPYGFECEVYQKLPGTPSCATTHTQDHQGYNHPRLARRATCAGQGCSTASELASGASCTARCLFLVNHVHLRIVCRCTASQITRELLWVPAWSACMTSCGHLMYSVTLEADVMSNILREFQTSIKDTSNCGLADICAGFVFLEGWKALSNSSSGFCQFQ